MKPRRILLGAKWAGGVFERGSKVRSFERAFRRQGHETLAFNFNEEWKPSRPNRLLNKARRVPRYFGTGSLNQRLLRECAAFRPDFVLLWKPIGIRACTILELKEQSRVGLRMDDDVFNPRDASVELYRSIPMFDAIFTTKSFNVPELRRRGASNVVFLPHAVDPDLYQPVPLSPEDQSRLACDVSLIGNYESHRARLAERLVEEDFVVHVYGDNWDRARRFSALRGSGALRGRSAYFDDFARVVAATKINLGVLRKTSRDLQTARTYDIPACGGFMLHERTEEVEELLGEDKGVACFGSEDELVQKVRFFIGNEAARRKIAAEGLKRISRPENHYDARAQRVVDVMSSISSGARRP